MSVTRSTGALLGTDESTLTAIANNATSTGSEVDLLGDNTSVGDAWIYLVVTSTVAVGTVDLKLTNRRVSGQAYSKVAFDRSIVPTNGTQKIPLGRIPVSRYMNCEVRNNATGASA